MPKYEIPDDHEWADEKQAESDGGTQPVSVNRHDITIDDRRDAHGYEYGLEWMFAVENGVVTGYYLGHWLEGRTQSDPMLSPEWSDVPEAIKAKVRRELNVDPGEAIPTDLPDHYGEKQ
jgi:hypothetical protein